MQPVDQLLFDSEGLRVSLTQQGAARFSTPEPGATLEPERAVALCFSLLELFSPESVDLLRAALRRNRLRLVAGAGPEDAA